MQFSLIKILLLIVLGWTSSPLFAGNVCFLIGDKYNLFYDNARNPSLTLTLEQRPNGNIVYKDDKAPITWNCDNNSLSIKWDTAKFKGNIKGTVGLTGLRSATIQIDSGEINGRPLPFSYLSTRIIGSGGS